MVNVFAPHSCPIKSARTLDKKRLSRMCFESYEVLSAAVRHHIPKVPELKRIEKRVYKPSAGHLNHPVVHWVLKDTKHFEWLLTHAQALNEEYQCAYKKPDPCLPFQKTDKAMRFALKHLPSTQYDAGAPINFEGFFNFNQFRSDAKSKYDGNVVLRNSTSVHTRYKLYLMHKWYYLDQRVTEWSGLPPAWAFDPIYFEWLTKHFGKPKNKIPQLEDGRLFLQARAKQPELLSLNALATKLAKRIDGHLVRNKTSNVDSVAIFEDEENQLYRYFLSRQWGVFPPLIVVMLNPSTADAFKNDPTVQIIEKLANAMGFSGYIVLNMAAFRATEPKDMLNQADPIGAHNKQVIASTIRSVVHRWRTKPSILLAYGNNVEKIPNGIPYVNSIIQTCSEYGNLLHLEMTKKGHPRHPLYFDTSKIPQRYLPW